MKCIKLIKTQMIQVQTQILSWQTLTKNVIFLASTSLFNAAMRVAIRANGMHTRTSRLKHVIC